MPAPAPETVALARRLYIDGVRVADILAETKLPTATMYQCLDGCRFSSLARSKKQLGYSAPAGLEAWRPRICPVHLALFAKG